MGGSQPNQRGQSTEEVLAEGQEEADKLLDYQISWAMQSDEELLRLLRLNIVVLGLLASIFGAFGMENIQIDWISLVGICLSVLFWTLSVIIALITYKFHKIVRGFERWKGVDFEGLDFDYIKQEANICDYHQRVLEDYERMIHINQQNIDCKYTLHIGAVWIMVISLILFSLALGRAMLPTFGTEFFLIGLFVLLVSVVSTIILSVLMYDFIGETDRESQLAFLNPYDKDSKWR